MNKVRQVSIGVLALPLLAVAACQSGDEPSPAPTTTTTATVTETPPPTQTTEPTDEPTVTPTSPPTETGDPSDPESTPTQTGEEQTFLGQGMATFEHFTVELLPYDEATAPERIEGKERFEVEVCVTQELDDGGPTQISTAPWRMESPSGEVLQPVEGVYEPVFPPEGEYEVGECASGWLTFDEFEISEMDYVNVIYENSLGDRAIWNFH